MPFRDISGHQHLLQLLAEAAARGSLAPSLIFAGPDGVGKRMAAVALAQLLNCVREGGPQSKKAELRSGSDTSGAFELGSGSDMSGASELRPDAPGYDACGICSACARITRGVHADVLIVEPGETGAIKVDQVRDAIERAAYRPFEGRRRVVIIDDGDALVAEAQNALLKSLEEPPPSSMFVLVTSRPDMLLPTVRSRCQHLRFGRLAPPEVAAVLMRHHGYTAADAHAAASVSDGSVGAALDGASEEFAEARDAAAHLLRSVASTSDPRRRLDGARFLTGAGRAASDREELARRLRAVASMLRDIGLLRSRADERSLANADLRPMLEGLLRAFDAERVLGAFAAVDGALAALDRNASPKIVADWLAFQL